jgi:hypothetical protein
MVRAAATGAIDYSRGDPRDPKWWSRLALLLPEVAALAALEANRLRHAELVGLYALPGRTTPTLEQIQKDAWGLAETARRCAEPWTAAAEHRADADRATLAEAWDRVYGARDDPATIERIEATVALLKAQYRPVRGMS